VGQERATTSRLMEGEGCGAPDASFGRIPATAGEASRSAPAAQHALDCSVHTLSGDVCGQGCPALRSGNCAR
jgi:hypothetical protein